MELQQDLLSKLIIDFTQRLLMHHGMWYEQVQRVLGKPSAWKIANEVFQQSSQIQLKRLAKILPETLTLKDQPILAGFSSETLQQLANALAVNWLANDGIWFQTVEFSYGMNAAKQCNDNCWGEFSPFEAFCIKTLFNIKENSGLEGLKTALKYRLYAFINIQSFQNEKPDSFEFYMNDCRVQSARKRKGLADYPCKSGGMVEYTSFAAAIDPAIKTTCLACPPDDHPAEWFCGWRFFTKK
jgi:hypothetical protein